MQPQEPLHVLERMFQANRLDYKREHAGALLLQADNHRYPFSVHFTHDSNGWLRACTFFDRVITSRIYRRDEFCAEMMHRFNGRVKVEFMSARGRFFATVFTLVENVTVETQVLMRACTILAPLVQRVGEIGRWDALLISLAFLEPSEMWRA